jgi:hypothetical protein
MPRRTVDTDTKTRPSDSSAETSDDEVSSSDVMDESDEEPDEDEEDEGRWLTKRLRTRAETSDEEDEGRPLRKRLRTRAEDSDEEDGFEEEEKIVEEDQDSSGHTSDMDIEDFFASSQQAIEGRARREKKTPKKLPETEPATNSRGTSSRFIKRRLPDVQPTINQLVTRSARHEIPGQDNADAQKLSRLAFLIDSATSGGTCTAVLKCGTTLVVSQNATGKATAMNTGYLFGTLEKALQGDRVPDAPRE